MGVIKNTLLHSYTVVPRIHWFSTLGLPRPPQNLKIKKINGSCFKTRAKRERAVAWWNPAAKTCPVLDSSSFAPVPTLPHRTFLQSAATILAVHISPHVIALFVFGKPLLINWTVPHLSLLHKCQVIHSVRYCLRFHVTSVGLGTYYPWIRGHTCI
jgi:hypothetical protein